MQRRSFFFRILTGMWATVLAPFAFGCRPSAGGRRKSTSAVIPLLPVGQLKAGLSEFELYRIAVLVESAENGSRKKVGAHSIVCTHQTCLLKKSDGEGGYQCPCHGSRFAADGSVLVGPAVKPLPWYRLSVSPDDQLQVHINEPVERTWRLTL